MGFVTVLEGMLGSLFGFFILLKKLWPSGICGC